MAFNTRFTSASVSACFLSPFPGSCATWLRRSLHSKTHSTPHNGKNIRGRPGYNQGFLQPRFLSSRGLTTNCSYNPEFLQPGVLTTRGLTTRGLKPRVLQPGALTTRGPYTQGFLQPGVLTTSDAYNQRFVQPGVLKLGVRTTRDYTTRGSYNVGSYHQGFLQPGILQVRFSKPGVLTTRGLNSYL